MTESAMRRRLSRGALRALAWIAGGAAFAAPFAVLTVSPKPATAEPGSGGQGRRVIVVKEITRRVVVQQPAESAGVRYVYVGDGSGSSASAGSSGSSSSTSSTNAAPPPPSSSTGGS
jgi:hypothetical protein